MEGTLGLTRGGAGGNPECTLVVGRGPVLVKLQLKVSSSMHRRLPSEAVSEEALVEKDSVSRSSCSFCINRLRGLRKKEVMAATG